MSGNLHAKHWFYKLNKNSKQFTTGMFMETIPLTKDWGMGYMTERESLKRYIRTKLNPDAIIDYEIRVPATGEVFFSSEEVFKKKVKAFSHEHLLIKERPELVQIAHTYNIDPIGKTATVLVKKILEAQSKINEDGGGLLNLAQLEMEKTRINVEKRKTDSLVAKKKK